MLMDSVNPSSKEPIGPTILSEIERLLRAQPINPFTKLEYAVLPRVPALDSLSELDIEEPCQPLMK